MAKSQPKKYITNVKLYDNDLTGGTLRQTYSRTIVENAPIFPKPLEYKDIDAAFFEFVKNDLSLQINGLEVPTFTLYSNQRFTEYSQNWKHTDEEGNLLMNFKTVSREKNPKPGGNQGGLWNIPGEKRQTLLIRDVLEKNGNESYEIYSMKQPYCVDLIYRVGIITDMFENLNTFNQIINDKFKSRQYYIRPNGHFIPLTLEEISDNSETNLENRKFYSQSATIKAMAYIISQNDFKIEKRPKKVDLFMKGDSKRRKPQIDFEEYMLDNVKHPIIELTIDMQPYHTKTEFEIDTDFVVEEVELVNLRNIRLSVNDTPYYMDKGFKLKNGDYIKIICNQIDVNEKSQILLKGYNPSKEYIEGYLPNDVCDESVSEDEYITVE